MTLQYTLEESDVVTYQLFIASKSDRIKKKRLRSKWSSSVFYVLGAIYFYIVDAYVASVAFMLVAVLWAIFYPMYERRHYLNHYRKFVAERYRSATPEPPTTVEIGDSHIHLKQNNSESRIDLAEIAAVNEIERLIFIQLKGGGVIVIPKYFLPGVDALIAELKNIAARRSVPYNEELNWKWV